MKTAGFPVWKLTPILLPHLGSIRPIHLTIKILRHLSPFRPDFSETVGKHFFGKSGVMSAVVNPF
jgi:hypothetical protein